MSTPTTLNVKELVSLIKREITQAEQARQEQGEPGMFQLEGMELDIKFVVTKSEKAGADFNVVIASAGADVTYSSEFVQSIRLKFKSFGESAEQAERLDDIDRKLKQIMTVLGLRHEEKPPQSFAARVMQSEPSSVDLSMRAHIPVLGDKDDPFKEVKHEFSGDLKVPKGGGSRGSGGGLPPLP